MKNKCLIKSNLNFNNPMFPLYHIGTMDISKKSRHSYEGNGLSVSICPSAWESIAKIRSSNVWKLEKENMKLLDYYQIPDDIYEAITNWGVENGYLEEVHGSYKHTYFCDDIGRNITILCDSLEDAFNEGGIIGSYSTYEEYLESDEGDEEWIYPTKSYKATEKLKSISLVDINDDNCVQEQNFLIYVERNTDYDGVYWDEELDILGLSAPRGVIFNHKLDSFTKELVSEYGADCIENQLWEY